MGNLKVKFKLTFILLNLSILLLFFQNCGSEFESNLKSVSGSQSSGSSDKLVYVSYATATSAVADGSDSLKISIYIVDDINNPVSGIVPKFTIRGEYNLVRNCTKSDLNGMSECEITSTVAANHTLSVTYPSLYNLPIVFKAGNPWEIQILAGGGQSGNASMPLLVEPKFKVIDKFNNPIKNITVNFSVSNSGSLSKNTDFTDLMGIVSPGKWTVGTMGMNNLTASVGSLSVNLTAQSMDPNTNPLRMVYLPTGSCSTGKVEVYVNESPHPKFQFVNTGECIEVDNEIATKSLKVRCIDPTNQMLPSEFVGPAVVNSVRNPASSCSVIHKS